MLPRVHRVSSTLQLATREDPEVVAHMMATENDLHMYVAFLKVMARCA